MGIETVETGSSNGPTRAFACRCMSTAHDIADLKAKRRIGIVKGKLGQGTQRKLPNILADQNTVIRSRLEEVVARRAVNNEAETGSARVRCFMTDDAGISNDTDLSLIVERHLDGAVLVLLVNSRNGTGHKGRTAS
ncbi:hypothetical protein HG531_012533 [Fusarium graminearum]|nr:hypothetical protein HG531_012533 [Fusarium graminearum]